MEGELSAVCGEPHIYADISQYPDLRGTAVLEELEEADPHAAAGSAYCQTRGSSSFTLTAAGINMYQMRPSLYTILISIIASFYQEFKARLNNYP